MIKTDTFIVGMIATNCYLIEDEATGKRAVIDPGDDAPDLVREIDRRGGTLDYILLTHGHYDHIIGVASLCRRYHPVVCASADEMPLLQSGLYNRSSVHNIRLNSFRVDRLLSDGDVIELGESKITFLLTPGHTAGSGCYLTEDTLYSGDTVFCETVGRTDLPTGNTAQMMQSVRRIRDLQGDLRVLPGHDIPSSLDHERRYNPFMQ